MNSIERTIGTKRNNDHCTEPQFPAPKSPQDASTTEFRTARLNSPGATGLRWKQGTQPTDPRPESTTTSTTITQATRYGTHVRHRQGRYRVPHQVRQEQTISSRSSVIVWLNKVEHRALQHDNPGSRTFHRRIEGAPAPLASCDGSNSSTCQGLSSASIADPPAGTPARAPRPRTAAPGSRSYPVPVSAGFTASQGTTAA